MKTTYSTILNLERTDFGLLLFRLAISGLMLTHGIPKLITFFSANEVAFFDPLGLGMILTLGLAVFAEFVCSILVILGLGTRFAVIPLIATMAVAAFIVHWTDDWGTQEKPLIYMSGYLLLYFTGAGKFSLDQFFLKKK
jgi:putative oxidoreductase